MSLGHPSSHPHQRSCFLQWTEANTKPQVIKVQRISDWGACYHIHIISSSSRAQGVSQKRWEDCRIRGQGHLLRTVCLDKLWLPHKSCQSQYSQYPSPQGPTYSWKVADSQQLLGKESAFSRSVAPSRLLLLQWAALYSCTCGQHWLDSTGFIYIFVYAVDSFLNLLRQTLTL